MLVRRSVVFLGRRLSATYMTRGSVFTTEDCEEYLARLPDVYKREVIRSFKEHRPLELTSLADVT
jgi:hypothetical protein